MWEYIYFFKNPLLVISPLEAQMSSDSPLQIRKDKDPLHKIPPLPQTQRKIKNANSILPLSYCLQIMIYF